MSQVCYRLSNARYAGDLTSEGARLFGGRWNERGTRALYTASTVSLALLEMLVHVDSREELPDDYTVTVIEVDTSSGRIAEVDDLPPTRQAAQEIGHSLLLDAEILGFWVPSVVVRTERNLILNPAATSFREAVNVREMYVLPVDQRLGS